MECSRLVDEYFGSFLFKIGDVMDEERLSLAITCMHIHKSVMHAGNNARDNAGDTSAI